ncbi:hypothetical protein BJX68DRAFT_261816 [Aspergillus pseudodeflectus]|uniref:Uncharacterized protein n=1 Tax=Aspergillus pseudodeflectus TaxID=176178 RepID=A0ABR4L4P7_9EURO
MSRAEPELPPLTITGIGALRRLHNVKRLQVPLPFLLGFQAGEPGTTLSKVLPRTIEVLTITDALYFQPEWKWSDDDLLEAISLWLGDWRKTTPHLRRFHLLLGADLTEWGPAKRQQLKDLGPKAGVEIEATAAGGWWD